MKLKKDINLVDFLDRVQKCKYDVYMETCISSRLFRTRFALL